MLTKFNDSNDMNAYASDAIHSYLKDGYRIDAKESVIDHDKDKNCTFKAVLKKDVDGIECKTVITLSETGKDDSNKTCTYHKVETVGDTQWSEETRTFSFSTDKTKLNSAVKNHVLDNICRTPRMWWNHADDDFIDYYHDTVRNIFKDFGLHCDWFGDGEDTDNKTKDDDNDWSARHRKFRKCLKLISDPDTHDFRWIFLDDKKTSTDDESNADKKDAKWKCKCPSAYQKLDDYVKLNTDNKDNDAKIKFTAPDGKEVEAVDLHDKEVKAEPAKDSHIEGDGTVHVKVNKDDSVDDVYKKITDKQKDGLKEACDAKARKDWLASKDDPDEEEDLLKLVRLIFGR
jgi:hypothetical protein